MNWIRARELRRQKCFNVHGTQSSTETVRSSSFMLLIGFKILELGERDYYYIDINKIGYVMVIKPGEKKVLWAPKKGARWEAKSATRAITTLGKESIVREDQTRLSVFIRTGENIQEEILTVLLSSESNKHGMYSM